MMRLVIPRWIYRILKQRSEAQHKSVASIVIDILTKEVESEV